jgi:hypothetical protein
MAEPQIFKYSYRELAEMMIKKQGLREGFWGIYVNFGIGATNIGPTPEAFVPAAIVPVLEVGLQRFEQPNGLTVDAATVWEKRER